MKDNPSRWKNNGLPRKGWCLEDVEDTETTDNQCEWCGTSIRYIHHLYHPVESISTTCGCICAENLTGDYVNHKRKEKELRSKAAKKKRLRDNFAAKFRLSKNGNLFYKHDGTLIIIYGEIGSYKLRIGNIWGKKKFSFITEAALAAYDYLEKA